MLFLPVVFAQEFEPVITEPLQTISWMKVLLFLLVICGIIYWWRKKKTKAIKEIPKKKKEEEGVKWIGKPQWNYQWIIIGLLLLIILYQWFPLESRMSVVGGQKSMDSIPLTPDSRPQTIDYPPQITDQEEYSPVEEDIILDESIFPESPAEPVPEEIIPSRIPSPEISSPALPPSTAQSAEKELDDAKRAVADLFKAMTNANREGKDIKEARIAYGEANQLYYRAYLALNNRRDADSIELSHQAKERAKEGKAALS